MNLKTSNSIDNTQRNTCLAMPFPASIALAVLKARTEITQNNNKAVDKMAMFSIEIWKLNLLKF